MARLETIGILIFSVLHFPNAYLCTSPTTDSTATTSSPGSNILDEIKNVIMSEQMMFFSAGFMTASLIFSVGCFVSKYQTNKSKKKGRKEVPEPDIPLLANGPPTVYANQCEGSSDSDQKSYAYWAVDPNSRSTEDLSQSVSSTKRFRESYDFVERNRAQSSTDIDQEIPNPYNHVTIDMEETEYDNACYVKQRSEVKDPTYSHLGDVKPEIKDQVSTGIMKTITIDDEVKKENNNKKNKQGNGLQKEKKKKEETSSTNPIPANSESETKSNEHLPEIQTLVETVKDQSDNKAVEIENLKRSKCEYAVVVRKKFDTSDNTESKQNGSGNTFEITCETEKNESQIISGDGSNASSLPESSPEASAEESSVPSTSDDNSTSTGSDSATSGSESDIERIVQPAVVVNELYQKVTVSNDNVIICADEDSFEQTLDFTERT